MRKADAAALCVVIASFILAAYFYPQLPDNIVSHWDAQGRPDGYMPKFWALATMPAISAVLFVIFLAVPRIDPKRKNIKKFRGYYEKFVILVLLFLLYIHLLTIAWNLGMLLDIVQFLVPAFAALFYYAGALMQKANQNWFVGIRTPWTLSSKKVWDRTHKRGAMLFKACGLICLAGLAISSYAIFFVIVPVILATIYLFVYSYAEYRKEKN